PAVGDILGAWPHEAPSRWQRSVWTADWYALQPWEAADRKGFYYHAQQRRYGGDLQGVIDKLDYLRDLGVTAIYLNPLFESPSLHKYDAATYHHIDNNFGPDPAADRRLWARENPADPATWRWSSADSLFLRLIREAHRRGMKLIIDGVFNHVGTTFWAFQDVRRNGPRSPYASWFTITAWDNPATPEDEFAYQCWNGVKDLPEFRRDSADLAPGPAAYIHAIIGRWMDPNGDGDPSDGIDGWRLDVAEKVPLGFWRQFRRWVRGINPNAYITGEVWWEDWAHEKMFNAEPWLRGDAFDAVMNYRVAREACLFFKAHREKTAASEFDRRLRRIRDDYRPETDLVLMNLLDSHDTDRLGSMIVNAETRYDHAAGPRDNPDYDVRKPNDHERQIQRLMVLFQMTYLGAPMVYYGDEAGMWGADDPDERKPMVWAGMRFADEASHPFGKPRPRDPVAFDSALFEYYREAIALRASHPALRRGDFRTILTDDARDLYGFTRSGDGESVMVLLNNADTTRAVDFSLLPAPARGSWQKIFGAATIAGGQGGVRYVLPARSGLVL
ncbi:MAG TPA: glycoside hydrolase family 13 protein, partial [Bacteroidota bacterium]